MTTNYIVMVLLNELENKTTQNRGKVEVFKQSDEVLPSLICDVKLWSKTMANAQLILNCSEGVCYFFITVILIAYTVN